MTTLSGECDSNVTTADSWSQICRTTVTNWGAKKTPAEAGVGGYLTTRKPGRFGVFPDGETGSGLVGVGGVSGAGG